MGMMGSGMGPGMMDDDDDLMRGIGPGMIR